MALQRDGKERTPKPEPPGTTSNPEDPSSVASDPLHLAASCLEPILRTYSLLLWDFPADAKAWDALRARQTQPGGVGGGQSSAVGAYL